MNTVTLPRSKYIKILETQEKLRDDLMSLQKVVSHIAQDEISSKYIKKLSGIEKGLSTGKGIAFRNTKEVKKFFKSL